MRRKELMQFCNKLQDKTEGVHASNEEQSVNGSWLDDIFAGVRFWYPLPSHGLINNSEAVVPATVCVACGNQWTIEFDDGSSFCVPRAKLMAIFEKHGFCT